MLFFHVIWQSGLRFFLYKLIAILIIIVIIIVVTIINIAIYVFTIIVVIAILITKVFFPLNITQYSLDATNNIILNLSEITTTYDRFLHA